MIPGTEKPWRIGALVWRDPTVLWRKPAPTTKVDKESFHKDAAIKVTHGLIRRDANRDWIVSSESCLNVQPDTIGHDQRTLVKNELVVRAIYLEPVKRKRKCRQKS